MTRGEIWWVDFGLPFGSEPGWKRPSVIIQSDAFNRTAMHTVVVIPLTSNLRLADFPGNVLLPAHETGLSKDSVAVIPQIASVDKARLVERMDALSAARMQELAAGICMLLGL